MPVTPPLTLEKLNAIAQRVADATAEKLWRENPNMESETGWTFEQFLHICRQIAPGIALSTAESQQPKFVISEQNLE